MKKDPLQYFGLQYLVQPLSVNPTFTFIFSNFADAFFQSDNWGIHNAIYLEEANRQRKCSLHQESGIVQINTS